MHGSRHNRNIESETGRSEPHIGPPAPPDLAQVAVFLDFDGTLVEIAERPQDVSVPDAVPTLLNDLHARTGGATVLVSGRRIGDLAAFLPDFDGTVIGSHGAERRDGGELWQHGAKGSRELGRIVKIVRAWAIGAPDVLVEEKPCSVVLHFRQAPDRMTEGLRFLERVANEAEGFVLHHAKMAGEIHPHDVSKGHAIESLMQRWPSRRPVVFGDDLTDEGMFEVANRLGGYSIKVGEGETCARNRLAGPTEVVDTLRGWLGAGST